MFRHFFKIILFSLLLVGCQTTELISPSSVSPTLAPTIEQQAAATSTVSTHRVEMDFSSPLDLAGHTALVSSLVFSHSGDLLATTGGDRSIRIWDISTGESIVVIQGGTASMKGLDFSADDRLLASIEDNGSIAL